MSKLVKSVALTFGAMVLIALGYVVGTQVGAGLAEREIEAAEQGQS